MKYTNLNELVRSSSSTRRYFLSLPVEMQLALQKHNDYIHTSEELRRHVAAEEEYARHVYLSNYMRLRSFFGNL